ncbi:hypothetical protein Scep_007062 [Stephania cephalantha]|uniref:Aminotransferase-like plant mobile domain-containing protein n=1 Tax=Stephania cephalantha TaxID=152367 RepID=A0AAP0KBU7_9MAGN
MDHGPIDDSVLTLQALHRSTRVWNGPDPGILTIRRNSTALHRLVPLDERIVGYLEEAGFYGTARIGFIAIDWHLITALVERWRPETHTFHFPVGEMTITLQDVQIILGLPVDGLPITGRVEQDYDALCLTQLGFPFPENNKTGGRIQIRQLSRWFPNLPNNAGDVEVQRYARAYILQLLGGTLFADKSNNLVHITYLQFLEDFEAAGQYSWGSATMAHLYRQLCLVADIDGAEIAGPIILLQLWAWDRLPFLAPIMGNVFRNDIIPNEDLFPPPPFGHRWRHVLDTTGTSMHVLTKYREMIDMQTPDEVIWEPYPETVIRDLPAYCSSGRAIWRTRAPLLFFCVVEMYNPDKVMRQFDLKQMIPPLYSTSMELHKIDLRGKTDKDWSA